MNKNNWLSLSFFIASKQKGKLQYIENPCWNYLSFIGAGLGMLCCLLNEVQFAIPCLLFVFIMMNAKMIVYYKIYRQYQKCKYEIITSGSKYSFSNPKKLIIKKQ